MPERLNAVLTVIYLAFTEGYAATRCIDAAHRSIGRSDPPRHAAEGRALDGYHLLHAACADFSRRLGAFADAEASDARSSSWATTASGGFSPAASARSVSKRVDDARFTC